MSVRRQFFSLLEQFRVAGSDPLFRTQALHAAGETAQRKAHRAVIHLWDALLTEASTPV